MKGLFKDYDWFIQVLHLLALTEDDRDMALQIMMASELLGDPDWANVAHHCVRVAEVAEALCMEAQVDPSKVVLAAIAHDLKKKVEKKRANELIAALMEAAETEEERERIDTGLAFTQAAAEQATWLADHGVLAEIVQITEMTGHASLVHFIVGNATIKEEIMFVADNLCGGKSGDEVVMWDDRIPLLVERYPWLTTEGTDLLGGETYMQAQDRITHEILDRMAEMSEFETGEMLNRHLVEKFTAV